MDYVKEIVPLEYCKAEIIGLKQQIEKIETLMKEVMPYSWDSESKYAHGFYLELQDKIKALQDKIQLIKDYAWNNHNIQLIINKKGA